MITKENKYAIKIKKRIRIIVYPFFIMLLAILGTSCVQQRTLPTESPNISPRVTGNVNNESNTNSSSSQKSINNTQDSNKKVSIENRPNASNNLLQAHNYVLNLMADNDEALLNGNPVTLPTSPFVQNGTFYIPLEAVTKLLGGTYSFEDNIATIILFGNTTKYQIGSRSIIANGKTYVVSGSREFFGEKNSDTPIAVDEKYVPVVSNGTVFIPADFDGHYPYNGINAGVRQYPESRMVILGGFENERGINEIKLKDSYDDLPVSFRSQLQYIGVVGEVINYSIEEYKNDDLNLYVMRINKPYDDVEGMNGKVCAIKVLRNRYSTPRGLKTGDSAYRAWRLYGYEGFTSSFFYKVDSGTVSSFTFYTNYYGG